MDPGLQAMDLRERSLREEMKCSPLLTMRFGGQTLPDSKTNGNKRLSRRRDLLVKVNSKPTTLSFLPIGYEHILHQREPNLG